MSDESMIRLIQALIDTRTNWDQATVYSFDDILNTQPDITSNPVDDDKLNRIKGQFSVLNNKIINEKFKNHTCCICLDEYKSRQHYVKLRCNHGFHKKCIIKWLKSYNKTCPICRSDSI